MLCVWYFQDARKNAVSGIFFKLEIVFKKKLHRDKIITKRWLTLPLFGQNARLTDY